MSSCKEFALDDIRAIVAIPVEDMNLGASAWQVTPTILAASFGTPTLSHAITIGIQPAVTGGSLIPINRLTGKVKDTPADDVAGRLHTVDVSCEVDDRESDVWEDLLTLERTPANLLLTLRDGSQAFVSATEDSYLCEVSRDGAKTAVSFKVQNLMGLQLIVP